MTRIKGILEDPRWHEHIVRGLRFAGSIVFLAAGVFYVAFPPNTTVAFFDEAWPPMVWGGIYILGGGISAMGAVLKLVQLERLGVFMVGVASLCLVITQFAVMFDRPVTLTRGGGTLVYLAFLVWSVERWIRLGADVRAIYALPNGA